MNIDVEQFKTAIDDLIFLCVQKNWLVHEVETKINGLGWLCMRPKYIKHNWIVCGEVPIFVRH